MFTIHLEVVVYFLGTIIKDMDQEEQRYVRDTLWAELPEPYDEVSISVYRQKIYEYVYTRYKDVAWQRSPPII